MLPISATPSSGMSQNINTSIYIVAKTSQNARPLNSNRFRYSRRHSSSLHPRTIRAFLRPFRLPNLPLRHGTLPLPSHSTRPRSSLSRRNCQTRLSLSPRSIYRHRRSSWPKLAPGRPQHSSLNLGHPSRKLSIPARTGRWSRFPF